MSRSLPEQWLDQHGKPIAPPALTPHEDAPIVQDRAYAVITPLIGGGSDVRSNDRVTLIRGSSIRGQLRFWWRAIRGGQFTSLAALKQAEEILWGAASTSRKPRPSLVRLAVTVTNAGNDSPSDIGAPGSRFGYGAFPLHDIQGTAKQGVIFTLQLEFANAWPKYAPSVFQATPAQEVAAALWAWETFGGLGARTRRGFGAIQLVSATNTPRLPPDVAHSPAAKLSAANLATWLHTMLGKHVAGSTWPPDVPHLTPTSRLRVIGPYKTPESTLEDLLAKLKRFRHQRPNGRGRNRWPEPDALRDLTDTAANYTDRKGKGHDHRDPIYPGSAITRPPHITRAPRARARIVKFPRAAFGLPINFEFKRDDQGGGDPSGKNTLSGESLRGQKYDRLASPLLLRPLIYGNQSFGVAVVLDGSQLPTRLTVEVRTATGKRKVAVSADLSLTEAADLTTPTNAPFLTNASGNITTDVIDAFLNTL